MRHIWRAPELQPTALRSESLAKEMELLRAHFELPDDERLSRRPNLDSRLWNQPSVRMALLEVFENKCGYCESPLSVQDFAVHHHRPLMNAKGRLRYETTTSADHYVWYAYEWHNLIPACPVCARFKANQYPTTSKRVPPFTPWHDAEIESPVLIDPCRDKPFDHIAFRFNGTCTHKTSRGRETIETLKLNRSNLMVHRSAYFSDLWARLGQLRGNKYETILPTLEELFNKRLPFVGAAKLWLLGALLETSIRKSPPMEGEFSSELAGFIAETSTAEWQAFMNRLAGINPAFTEQVVTVRNPEANPEKPHFSRIRVIEIEHFKGIQKLKINLGHHATQERGIAPATVLLGENSVGKSSILQAIALGVMSPKLRSRINFDWESTLPRDTLAEGTDDQPHVIQSNIRVTFDDGEASDICIRRDGSFSSQNLRSGLILGYGAHRSFHDEQSSSRIIRKTSSIASLFEKNKPLPHSAAWLELLGEKAFFPVARALREILNLDTNDEIYRLASGEVLVRRHNESIPIFRLSDGYRSLFAMSLDIIRNMLRTWENLEDARGIVLIDEIELHLHPRWKMQIVSALRRAMPQVQFIYTTHDPLCLRGMLDGEVHVLIKDDEGCVQEMTGLPDVTAMRAEQLLTSEYFGLASTVEPETVLKLDRIVLSNSRSTSPDAHFSEQMNAFSIIGDTPEKQVVNEALRRHIIEQLRSDTLDRTAVREDAVNLILERLRADSNGVDQ
ncbi:AAA family ATPase [Pseudomonas fulva]|uniref:AAA family ATPase n=2 Tax=Pseudomonas TaxID=286 RepID=UPI001067E944|nr:AAA family ATPase [Pseudomonas sp. URIL14HWK12:I1]